MKLKRKSKRDELAWQLDFVTAYSLDECCVVLRRETAHMLSEWQRIRMRNDASFIIERLVSSKMRQRTAEIRFQGTLDSVSNGTHVQGRITEDTRRALRLEQRFTYFMGGFMLLIGIIMWAASGDITLFFGLLGVAAIMVTAQILYWRSIRNHAAELLHWIHQQLDVPID